MVSLNSDLVAFASANKKRKREKNPPRREQYIIQSGWQLDLKAESIGLLSDKQFLDS